MRFLTTFTVVAAAAPAAAFVGGASLGFGAAATGADYADFAGISPVADARFLYGVTPNWNAVVGASYRVGHKPNKVYQDLQATYAAVVAMAGCDYRMELDNCMPYFGGGLAAAVCRDSYPTKEGLAERQVIRPGVYGEVGLEYYVSFGFGFDIRGRILGTFGGTDILYERDSVAGSNYATGDLTVGLFLYP